MNKDCGCGFIVTPVEFSVLEALLFKVQIRVALFPVPLRTPCGQAVREGRDTDFPVRCPAVQALPIFPGWSCILQFFSSLPWDISFVSGFCHTVCKCEVISRSQILYFTCVRFRLSLEVFLLCLFHSSWDHLYIVPLIWWLLLFISFLSH